jgi:hypothetical protein
MTKPDNVKVNIWMLGEQVSDFLEGDYNVIWCEERKELSGTWNRFVLLTIEPADYIKLKATRESTLIASNTDTFQSNTNRYFK